MSRLLVEVVTGFFSQWRRKLTYRLRVKIKVLEEESANVVAEQGRQGLLCAFLHQAQVPR